MEKGGVSAAGGSNGGFECRFEWLDFIRISHDRVRRGDRSSITESIQLLAAQELIFGAIKGVFHAASVYIRAHWRAFRPRPSDTIDQSVAYA